VGDAFVNAPVVSYPYCFYPGIAFQGDDTNAICIADLGTFAGSLVQFGVTRHDVVGAGLRRLGSNYARWNQFDVFWNGNVSPDGSFMATLVRWMDGVRSDALATVLPPYPNSDGVSRNTFIPISVAIQPPPGLPVQSAVVEFGYVENGDAANYYCTSRQETCVATAAAVNLNSPFAFEQTETYVPAPCSAGCTIAIPALPQRALYYRWKYIGSTGQVIETSQTHVVLTP
jgi:hypothetical protein